MELVEWFPRTGVQLSRKGPHCLQGTGSDLVGWEARRSDKTLIGQSVGFFRFFFFHSRCKLPPQAFRQNFIAGLSYVCDTRLFSLLLYSSQHPHKHLDSFLILRIKTNPPSLLSSPNNQSSIHTFQRNVFRSSSRCPLWRRGPSRRDHGARRHRIPGYCTYFLFFP